MFDQSVCQAHLECFLTTVETPGQTQFIALPKPTRCTKKCELASSGVTPIFTNAMAISLVRTQ